jgi:hypothetical protein
MEWMQPDTHYQPTLWVLKVNDVEVARIKDRGDGLWVSDVNRHVRDWNRHRCIFTPSRRIALLSAERYTKAHMARILTELPEMRPGGCGMVRFYPPTNPDPMAGFYR